MTNRRWPAVDTSSGSLRQVVNFACLGRQAASHTQPAYLLKFRASSRFPHPVYLGYRRSPQPLHSSRWKNVRAFPCSCLVLLDGRQRPFGATCCDRVVDAETAFLSTRAEKGRKKAKKQQTEGSSAACVESSACSRYYSNIGKQSCCKEEATLSSRDRIDQEQLQHRLSLIHLQIRPSPSLDPI